MKKCLLFSPIFALLLAACSNEFDVTGPWKEIPVVYAILSPNDTAHYIRVEKAFLDPVTGADVIAQIADSLYYPENAIAVYLEQNSNKLKVQLHRVDGVKEGIVRAEGFFATHPNWLYKLPATPANFIKPGERYNLIIERADGKTDITSSTVIPKPFSFRYPDPLTAVPFLAFTDTTNTEIRWLSDTNAVFFNVTFDFGIREETATGQVLEHKTLRWTPIKGVKRETLISGGQYTTSSPVSGKSFLQFLHDNLEANGRYRVFEGITITLEGGGKEIEPFLETLQANSGLTGAETFPTYTNLSEGYGIFTSKSATLLTGVRLSPPTVKIVQESPLTNVLRFY